MKPIQIFCDGAGARPDGKGSGFAWIQPQSGKQQVLWLDGLTGNQAEYHAVISALRFVPARSHVEILADSGLLVGQLSGAFAVRDPKLEKLHAQVQEAIRKSKLTVKCTWIPRARNIADRLLHSGSRGKLTT